MNENKVLAELKKISMTPTQKTVLWSKLNTYAKKHEPVKQLSYYATFLQYLKSFFTPAEK